jgi:hypothetical protein
MTGEEDSSGSGRRLPLPLLVPVTRPLLVPIADGVCVPQVSPKGQRKVSGPSSSRERERGGGRSPVAISVST